MRALRFSFLLLFIHRAASSDGIEFSAKQVTLVQEQAADLMYWSQALLSGKTAFFSRTSLRGSDRKIHNAGSDSGGSQPFGDTLAFDYAPSYGVHVDGMQFDAELREAMRATSFLDKHKVRFPPPYHTFALPPETHCGCAIKQDTAVEIATMLFGHAPFLAAHLRRDDYEHFCFGVRKHAHAGTQRICWCNNSHHV